MKELLEEMFAKKIFVGKVSKEMVDLVKELDARHQAEHERIKKIIEERLDAVIEACKKEFQHVEDALKDEHDVIWQRIHDEIGTPENERFEQNFTLHKSNGVVSKVVPHPDLAKMMETDSSAN